VNILQAGVRPNGIYRLMRRVLPLALAVGLLGALLTRANVSDVWAEVSGTDLRWVPMIVVALYASDCFRAFRWQQVLSPIARPGLFLLFAAAQLGSATNLLLPIRAGEAVRVGIVNQRTGISAASLIASWFGEVVSDLVVFVGYIIVGVLLVKEAGFLWPLAPVGAVLIVAGGAGAYYLAGLAERTVENGEIAPKGLSRWLRRELYNLQKGLLWFRAPKAIFHVTWSAQGIWICETVMFYACGRALDLDLSPGAYLLVIVVANVAGAVPITPSGFGVFEVTLTGLIVALGADQAQAAAYAIFVHLFLTFPHIISGPLCAIALRLDPAAILLRGNWPQGDIGSRS